jgi:hypothetical protein
MKDIAWADHRTAYGTARTVPDLLRRAAQSEEWKPAMSELANLVNHQGTVYSAAVPVTPMLLGMLTHAEKDKQSWILVLLARVSKGPAGRGPKEVDLVAAIRATMAPHLDEIAALVGSGSPEVALASLQLLSLYPEAVRRHAGAIRALTGHESPYLKGMALLTLARAGLDRDKPPAKSWKDEAWRDAVVDAWDKITTPTPLHPLAADDAVDEAMCIAMAAFAGFAG